jgi:Asp-tRNA(Asn)/Glu-tRNA(Gln) amidotransferase A subunit family amidase
MMRRSRSDLFTTLAVACVAAVLGAQTRGLTTPFDVVESTIDDIHAALGSGRVTCHEVVQQYLDRIDAYNHRGATLNAVITVNARASAEADRLDSLARTAGQRGMLHCIPTLVKDQLDTSDMATTFGSAAFKDFVPTGDATVVKKLREAGAIIIGKAAMGEFASGYAGSVSGPIRNPYDPTRHPSGSSGGTGAGVAANFATVGIGEDTGGSIRGPAAAGSLVGLRPTLPLVSRHGVLPFRPSYDTVGPIARTSKDAALVLDVIAGYDPGDAVTAYAVGRIPRSFAAGLTRDRLKGARIGVIRHPLIAGTDIGSDDYKNIHTVIDRAFQELGSLGAEIVGDVVVPDAGDRVARAYDGNVYEPEAAINAYLEQHVNAPLKTLRDVLLTGKVLPSRATALMNVIGRSTGEPGYLDVLRITEETRRLVLGSMARQRLDALVYATADHSPDRIASDVMTNPKPADTRRGSNRTLASIMAFPAISVPAGFTPDGMPVGLEFMARPFDDEKLLQYAYAYEQATRHRKAPTLTPSLRVGTTAR